MITINLKKIYNRLLQLAIVVQIFINSTNTTLKNTAFKYTQYFLWALMIALLLFLIHSNGITQRTMISVIIFLFITIIATLFNDKTIIPLFIFSTYCIYMDNTQIVSNYLKGITTIIIITVLLSISGFLPIKTGTNLLSFGFNNPNVFGFLLVIVYIGYCILNRYHLVIKILLAISLVCFNIFFLDDNTASIVIILFCILQLIHFEQINYFLQKMTIIMPELLLFVSYFLMRTYGKYKWTYSIDSFLTNRPQIWSFYNNLYGISLFPQKIQIYSLSNYEYFFFGQNLPLQYRGFDGAYIYLLIFDGIIMTIFILIAISYFVAQLDLKKEQIYICSTLSILIFGITESVAIAPFGYFENFLLILVIRKVLLGSREIK